eukprot:5964639-Pyramimonas_sp.AAC.2
MMVYRNPTMGYQPLSRLRGGGSTAAARCRNRLALRQPSFTNPSPVRSAGVQRGAANIANNR